jgi:hypothetical protein
MDTYPWFAMQGIIDTKSTGSQELSLNHVNHFNIKDQLPTDYKCLRRLTNVQKLTITEPEKNSQVLFHNIITYIDISRTTTFFIAPARSKIDATSFVRFISSMPNLSSLSASIIHVKSIIYLQWPNIRRLAILVASRGATITERSLTSNEIDVFYRSFTHIEYLSFHQNVILNPTILLNNIPKTISNIVIYHAFNITPADFPEFVTCNWLEQNTRLRHFLYSCNELNVVSLWL